MELEIDTEGTPLDPAPTTRFRGPESAFAAAQEQAGEWKEADASPEAMDVAPQDQPEGSSPKGDSPQAG